MQRECPTPAQVVPVPQAAAQAPRARPVIRPHGITEATPCRRNARDGGSPPRSRGRLSRATKLARIRCSCWGRARASAAGDSTTCARSALPPRRPTAASIVMPRHIDRFTGRQAAIPFASPSGRVSVGPLRPHHEGQTPYLANRPGSRLLWELAVRFTVRPMRNSAAITRRAFADGHSLISSALLVPSRRRRERLADQVPQR